jgi:hypothetical protein
LWRSLGGYLSRNPARTTPCILVLCTVYSVRSTLYSVGNFLAFDLHANGIYLKVGKVPTQQEGTA